jgi:hypothetical protein
MAYQNTAFREGVFLFFLDPEIFNACTIHITKVRDEYTIDQPSLLTWSKFEAAALREERARR